MAKKTNPRKRMSRPLGSTRVFGGKTFSRERGFQKKRDANKYKETLKKRGKNVRIREGTTKGDPNYIVYSRSK